MSRVLAVTTLAVAASGATIGLVVAAAIVGSEVESQPWKLVLLPAFWAVPGALVAVGRPASPLGWLLIAVGGLFAGSAFATQWVESGHTSGASAAIWLADRGSSVLVPCTLAVLLLLPNGRLPGPKWRPVAFVAIGAQLALVVAWCLVSGPAASADSSWPTDPANPVGVLPSGWSPTMDAMSSWVLQLPLLLGLAAVGVRLLQPVDEVRRGLVGVLAAASVFALLVVVGRALWPAASDVLDVCGSVLLAAALTSAVLQRRVPGIEVVVHQAFVYSVLTALIALAYIGVVAAGGGLGQDLPSYGVGVVTAVIALCLLPLRRQLQGMLDRAMYGEARDLGAAVRRLADTVGDATSLDEAAAGLARATAASLRATYVEVEVEGRRVSHGAPLAGDRVRLPLISGEQRIGAMLVELPRGRRVGQRDHDLIAELADHGARALRAVQLADALLVNRQLLVTAREEERSRLRRDLHDELGPILAGLAMQLGGLQEILRTDPAVAAERLARLEISARQALNDVRRVSRELRPPSLDELGLVDAIIRAGDEAGVVVVPSGTAPDLPPAVEVAAFRIGVEAVLNVGRHAGVRRAGLDVSVVDGALVLRISDDGAGLGAAPAGVGILAMRERAEEIGGSLTVSSTGPGTSVDARLPLATVAAYDEVSR